MLLRSVLVVVLCLAQMPLVRAAEERDFRLGIGGFRFDPLNALPAGVGELGEARAADQALVLVQFQGPVQPEWRFGLEALGARIVDYVPHYAYLISLPPSASIALSALPGVRAVADYAPALKLTPGVRALGHRLEPWPLILGCLPDDVDDTLQRLRALGAVIVDHDALLGQARVRISASGTLIDEIARDAAVISLSLDLPQVVEGEVAKRIIDGSSGIGPGVSPPGYQGFLTQKGVDGTGVTVAVIDNGVDINDGSGHLNGRIVSVLRGASEGSANGHGHHVAGIVAGQCTHPPDPGGYLWGIGVAPGVSLLNIPALHSGYTGSDQDQVRDSVTTPSTNGAPASIASCSWNNGEGADYTMAERTWDSFVRDADDQAPGLQPLFLSFSAGNTGPGPSSLTRPHAGKNLVTVANAHSYRPSLGNDDLNRLSITSSRGPAADGRIKPDLTAPGTNVSSAQYGFFGCGPNMIDAEHVYCSGTSMAQPHVAGAAALFSEWWQRGQGSLPSPALIKAALVHGARDLTDTGEGKPYSTGPIPNPDEGWGLVNLDLTVAPATPTLHRDEGGVVLTASGQEWTIEVALADPNLPLNATLVWTDAPGAVGASPALVNDLDLSVEGSLGIVWLGNALIDGESDPVLTQPDRLNTVEAIRVPRPPHDVFTVRVRAENLVGDALPGQGGPLEQDFALIVENALVPTSDGIVRRLGGELACSGRLEILVADADLAAGPTVQVTSTTEPSGESVALSALSPGSRLFRGGIELASGAPSSDGRLQVASGDVVEIRYIDADDGRGGINVLKTVQSNVDCQGPVLSGIDAAAVDDRTLRVRWQTDEPATSQVTILGSGRVDRTSELVTVHEIVMGGLDSCARYALEVGSADASGNLTVDDAQGSGHLVTLPHRRPILHADFEADGGGFTHFGPRDEWEWGAPLVGPATAFSGDRLWGSDLDNTYAKDGETGLNGRFVLLSPPIDLTSAVAPRLRLRHWHDIATDGATDDGAWVELWDGSAWIYLSPQGGYGDTVDADAPLPPSATLDGAWAGESLGFIESEFDLAPYVGAVVQVRVVLFEEDDFLAGAPGLYVDDFTVFDLEDCDRARLTLGAPAAGCGADLRVAVEDAGLNTSSTVPEQATVRLHSDSEPLGEPLSLLELGPNRGRFEATMPLDGGPVSPDSILQIRTGDRVWARYRDDDDGTGRSALRLAEIHADCTAPAIGAVHVVDETDRSVTIEWVTDEPATSRVEYGPTPALGLSVEDRSLVRHHRVRLRDLSACSSYRFQVASEDLAGARAVDDADGTLYRFTTREGDGIRFLDDFELERGWTFDGEWERDRPRGRLFATSASMDPNAARTLDRVLGVDLTGQGQRRGNYEPGASSSAVSPAIDASGLGQVELRFYRWLGVDRSDTATIEVSGDGGGNWTNIWSNPVGVDVGDRLWTEQIFDITGVAAGRPDVRVRFALSADGATESMGWQIDDLMVHDPTRAPWTPCAAELVLDSYRIDDSAGNGNGLADPGELVRLLLRLGNAGSTVAQMVAGRVVSGRPDLAQATQPVTSFPDIAAGGLADSLAPQVELQIAPLATCGEVLPLTVSMERTGGGSAEALEVPIGVATSRMVTITGPPGSFAVPDDDATGIAQVIGVTEQDLVMAVTVDVSVSHPDGGELVISLTGPGGEVVVLHNLSGKGVSYSPTSYPGGSSPDGPGTLQDYVGRSPQGDWTLRVLDGRRNTVGTLDGWTLHLTLRDDTSAVTGPIAQPLWLARSGSDVRAEFGLAPAAVLHVLEKGRNPEAGTRAPVASSATGPLLEIGGAVSPGSWFYSVRGVDSCGRVGP